MSVLYNTMKINDLIMYFKFIRKMYFCVNLRVSSKWGTAQQTKG